MLYVYVSSSASRAARVPVRPRVSLLLHHLHPLPQGTLSDAGGGPPEVVEAHRGSDMAALAVFVNLNNSFKSPFYSILPPSPL